MSRVSANGIELEFETFGDRACPAVVLVMGYAAQLTRWPVALCEELAGRGFYVVRFDNRDVGLSTKLDDLGIPDLSSVAAGTRPPYTLEDMAADTVALLDALGLPKAHIVGASMGGAIAQLVASGYPDRTQSLTSIMASSGNPVLPQASEDVLALLVSTPDPSEFEAVVARSVQLAKIIGSPSYPEANVRARIERDVKRNYHPGGMIRQFAAIMANGDRRPQLAKIDVPTVVLHGREDPVVPVACGRDTAASIRGAILIEIPGMGHDFPVALTGVFADAICKAADTGLSVQEP